MTVSSAGDGNRRDERNKQVKLHPVIEAGCYVHDMKLQICHFGWRIVILAE